ncbi:hypothetical protein H0H81_001564 [Sphagnurus paluster]|uniref:Uncharacterized protein n=1 Tax=Sphagnurus paluster TaxID=117069 RepID=A0A9P7FTH3_9AGAR|nr:hypothetical protein H0H81_001564 [Sphagnurus paluster]
MPALSWVALSPAWDPSSRTPNPEATYYIKAYNTWMNSPLLANKHIRVLFADTIPCEQHGGWKNGEMEGRTALWVGAKNGEALLQQANGKALNVPE